MNSIISPTGFGQTLNWISRSGLSVIDLLDEQGALRKPLKSPSPRFESTTCTYQSLATLGSFVKHPYFTPTNLPHLNASELSVSGAMDHASNPGANPYIDHSVMPPITQPQSAKREERLTRERFIELFQERWPNEAHHIIENTQTGAMIIESLSDPMHFGSVAGEQFLVQNPNGQSVTEVFYAPRHEKNIQWSGLSSSSFATRQFMSDILMGKNPYGVKDQTYGAWRRGFEIEFLVIDPETGQFYPYQGPEAIYGMGEVMENMLSDDLVEGLQLAALEYSSEQERIRQMYGPDTVILCVSTNPTQSSQDVVLNDIPNIQPTFSRYYLVSRNFLNNLYSAGDRDLSKFYLNQIAKAQGADTFLELLENFGDVRPCTGNIAGHVSASAANIPNAQMAFARAQKNRTPYTHGFTADAQQLINLADLISSKFGTLARLLNLTGPYAFNHVVRNKAGDPPYDFRVYGRQVLGIARPVNRATLTPDNLARNIKATLLKNPDQVEGGFDAADRLERAGAVNISMTDNGEIIYPTAQGDIRFRINDTGHADLRVEFAALGSAGLREKMQGSAILGVFQTLSMHAAIHEQNIFEYFKTNAPQLTPEVMYGTSDADSAEGLVTEYTEQGPKSPQFKKYVKDLKILLDYAERLLDSPEFSGMTPKVRRQRQQEIETVRTAIDSLQKTAKDLYAFAQGGQGVLGAAAREMALLDQSAITFMQEAGAMQQGAMQAILDHFDDEEALYDLIIGRKGFGFKGDARHVVKMALLRGDIKTSDSNQSIQRYVKYKLGYKDLTVTKHDIRAAREYYMKTAAA